MISLERRNRNASRVEQKSSHTNIRRRRRVRRTAWQIAIVVVWLGIWQWLPDVPGITHVAAFIDPFFISSPVGAAAEIGDLVIGRGGVPFWSELGITVAAALIGTTVAVVVGAVGGLLCGGSEELYGIVRPFTMALNAIPRITLVPVIVLIFGTSPEADAITAAILVVFIVFYNAVEGARNVSPETLEFVRLLGGSPRTQLMKVRAPYSIAWVFASLPNAISFGLVGAVTSELFTGSRGVGELMVTAVDTANASLTFAVVIILSVVGVILVQSVDMIRKRTLSWWDASH